MKRILILLLLIAGIARAQNVRYDAPFPSISSQTSTPFLVANVPPNSPVLAVCTVPANAVPCTNYATTYNSANVACLNGAQDTPQPQPSACQPTGDAQGNIGFWAPAGNYDYTVCIANDCFGPYRVTLGGTGTVSPLTTKGDIYAFSSVNARLPVGANGTCLTADSTQILGLTWGSCGGGGNVPTGVANGSALVSNGVSQPPVYQLKPAIDVRDLGVDCSGNIANAAANSTALNTLTATPDAITGRTVIFPVAPNGTVCFVKITNTWLIKNQTNFVIDFMGRGPGNASAGLLFCVAGGTCNAGKMVDIEYSASFEIRGGYIDGANIAAVGINIDKDGSGGSYTTTNGYVHDMQIAAGPAGTQTWTGIYISLIATSNVEDMKIERNNLGCAFSPPNTQVGVHIGANQNAKNEKIHDNQFTNCLYQIWKENGGFSVYGNEFRASGACGSGPGADIRDDANTDPDVIHWNLDENGTHFFNCANDSGSCNLSNPVSISYNNFSPFGCENLSDYWIETGTGQPIFEFRNNHFDADNSLVKIIGTNTANIFQQQVYQSGNVFPNVAFNLPWLNGAQGNFDDMGVTVGSQILAPVTNTTQGAYPSPFVAFRSYLNTHPNADDFVLQTVANKVGVPATFLIKHQQGTAGAMVSVDGAMPGLVVSPITSLSDAPGVNATGATGVTSYTYAVVAYYGTTQTVGGPTTAIGNGNSTLTASNFNQIQWQGTAGATKYCIWRTASGGTPSSVGNIGCVSAIQNRNNPTTSTFGYAAGYTNNQIVSNNFYVFNDTGLAGDSAALPATNLTGQIVSTTPTGLAPFAVSSTTSVANLTVANHPTLEDCGTTSTCAKTQKTAALIVRGSVAFPTATTVTVTSLPFTSNASYSCTAGDTTAAAGIVNATTYTSGSSVTFTETGGANTDTMNYICAGW